jgi:hypothetical protein
MEEMLHHDRVGIHRSKWIEVARLPAAQQQAVGSNLGLAAHRGSG